jgi:hypothetical protein
LPDPKDVKPWLEWRFRIAAIVTGLDRSNNTATGMPKVKPRTGVFMIAFGA